MLLTFNHLAFIFLLQYLPLLLGQIEIAKIPFVIGTEIIVGHKPPYLKFQTRSFYLDLEIIYFLFYNCYHPLL